MEFHDRVHINLFFKTKYKAFVTNNAAFFGNPVIVYLLREPLLNKKFSQNNFYEFLYLFTAIVFLFLLSYNLFY